MIAVSVRVRLEHLTKFLHALRTFASATGSDPRLGQVFQRWAVRYRSFALERFDRFSKGGGDWKPLAPSTVARKTRRDPTSASRRPVFRSNRGRFRRLPAGVTAILVDTGTMKAALNPAFVSVPGQLQERLPLGVRVGFGGPGTHRFAGMTVARLAEIHHSGDGVPRREIIVSPPEAVQTAMARDVERAVREIVQDAGTRSV